MLRFLAGAASCFLLLTGAFLIWQGHAEKSSLPPAPAPRGVSMAAYSTSLTAPEASAKSREERRFSRADKNKDGKIEGEELLGPRHKAFAKLDTNGNGALSFDEWAVKTIDKFKGADKDRSGWLTPAEYATTAPPPPKHKTCSCDPAPTQTADNSDD
jgi:EF hand